VSKLDPTESDIARLREASTWIQRLNESNSQAAVEEWLQWCESDPLNLPIYEQMQNRWNVLARAGGAPSPMPLVSQGRQRRTALISLAASIVLVVGVAGWLTLRHADVQVQRTAIGEQRRMTLADGSYIDLAPASRVSDRYTLTERNVQLERGQAFFAVAHSAVRPFIVRANSVEVTAAGTEFDVRIDPNHTVVTVSEGRVRVAPGTGAAGAGPPVDTATVRAGVGERVTYSESSRRLSVARVDTEVAESWRDGRLQFESDSLEDVVAVINRYSAHQIAVAPALRQTRFTGTVSPGHVPDWLKALEQIYAVEMVDEGANGVLIETRIGKSTHG